jgi:glycosyltransferase involved in cell wall biosynthesis
MIAISHLLFFGSMMVPDECQASPDCPFSANRFQFELLTQLLANYASRVTAVCPIPARSYPRRRLFFGRHERSPQVNFQIISPAFINFGPVKVLSLLFTVFKTAAFQSKRIGKPQIILLYNPYLGFTLSALFLARIWRIPVVGIIADLSPAPIWSAHGFLRQIEAALQRWVVKQFDALLPFSIHVITDLDFKRPYMRLAPGVETSDFEKIHILEPGQYVRSLFFSGTLNYANGLQLLLDSFALVSDPTIQLWISGRGDMQSQVEDATKKDARIHFCGFVTREELLKLMQQSLVLINPRPAFLPEHRYNFPSKILEYLAVGRPVISTATSDVAEEYGQYLILLEKETPQALAHLIDAVFTNSLENLNTLGQEGRYFVLAEKNWTVLGQQVADFLMSLN